MERKTPLYERHEALGGRLVPFAGWLLPVQYKAGVIAEHNSVRGAAGLFDVSHMGEALFEGRDALANINRLLTNDFTSLEQGRARYSPMCAPDGGIIDDLIVYRLGAEKYLIVLNASNAAKDLDWFAEHITGEMKLTDLCDETAQIALQGPKSEQIISSLTESEYIPHKYYSCVADAKVAGHACILSRTGYTGEDGFEIYCPPSDAPAIWDALLAAGEPFGLVPCGLGARDTLRLEAAMPLYGHEMSDEINPFEAGLGRYVKLEKPDFIGKSALETKTEPSRIRVGLKITGRGIVREHETIYNGVSVVGRSTSGTFCPHLGGPYAMAIVNTEASAVGTKLEADVRGRRVECEVVQLPFYKRVK